jgi:hypothetical protein
MFRRLLVSRWFLPAALPVAAAVVYGLIWILYLSGRSHVEARADATLQIASDPRTSGSFLVSGKGASFKLTQTSAGVVDVSESTGLGIELPLSRGVCAKLSGCRDGELRTVPPFTVSWLGSRGVASATRTDVGTERASFQTGNGDIVGIVSSGSTPSRVCLQTPFAAGRLRLTMGAAPPVEASTTDADCYRGQSFRVRVSHGRSPAGREALFFERVRGLQLVFDGSSLELTGEKTGTLHVDGSTSIGNEPVTLRGPRVEAVAELSGKAISLTVPTFPATSVRDTTTELVPTNFARHQTFVLTLLGILGLPVLGFLGKVGQRLRDKIGGSNAT